LIIDSQYSIFAIRFTTQNYASENTKQNNNAAMAKSYKKCT